MQEDLLPIIKGCIDNNRVAQEKLYKKYSPMMLSIIKKYYGDDYQTCELILNDAFLRIFQRIHLYGFKGSFEGWIRIITTRQIYNYHKSVKKVANAEISCEIYDNSVSVENEANSKLSIDYLLSLIDKLGNTQKEAFNLFIMEGLSHREIGKKLGIAEGTSKWHINDAKKKLKLQLINY